MILTDCAIVLLHSEVLPGALPPLTLSLFRFMFDNLGKYIFLLTAPAVEFERSAYPYTSGFSIGKRVFMNFSEVRGPTTCRRPNCCVPAKCIIAVKWVESYAVLRIGAA